MCFMASRSARATTMASSSIPTNLGVVYWHDAANEFVSLSPFPVVFGLDGLYDDEDSEGEPMSPGDRDWREGCDTV
jgi:hypothetical protein